MPAAYTPTFAEKVAFGKEDKIMVYYGRNGLGAEFFCYIRCGLEGYRKMKDDYLTKASVLPESYGDILYKDYLPEPDEKAKAFLKAWLAEHGGSAA